MRTSLFTLLLLLCFSMVYGQKVKTKNTRIPIEFASMPIHKTSPDARTYSLEVEGNYKFDTQEIGDALNLRGWTYAEEGGAVVARIDVDNFIQGRSDYTREKKQSKNKEGKVTATWYEYTYSSTNTGLGSLKVFGPADPYKAPVKKTKSSERIAKKKAEEKKKKDDNPFLKGVDLEESNDDAANEAGLVARYDLTQRYTVTGKTTKDLKSARSSYNNVANEAYAKQLDRYANKVISNTNFYLNKTYGYNKRVERAKFKTLSSKKHPEYEMYNQATDALKAIFATKKFNKPTDEVITSMEPLIGYFKSITEKYSKDDKHQKRLKAASLYNLAQIYYYLDMPDKVMEVGNEYIAWDHDVKIGKNFIEKAKSLKHLLAFHDVNGRYFVTNEDADAIEGEEIEGEDDDDDGAKK
ncbi:MAG: hypothetical protein AB8F74_18675 [Saprospiraceae bacterium]